MRFAAASIVMLLLSGCSLFGPASPATILRTAEAVQSATTGPAAAESYYVRAYRRILTRPDAARVFADIYENATPAGKIYALAGLYDTDRKTFERLLARDSGPVEATIDYTDGCIVRPLAPREVREKLAEGYFSRMWRSGRRVS